MSLLSAVAAVLIVIGLFFFTAGVIGVLRLPDFYTRQHASGKCDSFASVLILLGIALYNLNEFTVANLLVSFKIMAVTAFVFIASPTATHAITEAALIVGVEPWTKEKKGK